MTYFQRILETEIHKQRELVDNLRGTMESFRNDPTSYANVERLYKKAYAELEQRRLAFAAYVSPKKEKLSPKA